MAADQEPREADSQGEEERIPIRDVKVFIKEHLLEFQAVDVSVGSIRLHHLDWRFHVDQKLTMKLTTEGMTLVSDLPAVVVEMDEETVLCRFLYRDSRQRILILDLINRAKSKNVLAGVDDDEATAPAAYEDEASVLVRVLTDLKRLPGREEPLPEAALEAEDGPEACPVCLTPWQRGWGRCATCGHAPGDEVQDDEVRVIMELEDPDEPVRHRRLATPPLDETETVLVEDIAAKVAQAGGPGLDATAVLETIVPEGVAPQEEIRPEEADQESEPAQESARTHAREQGPGEGDTQDWDMLPPALDDFAATVLMEEVPALPDEDEDLDVDIDLATDGEEPPPEEAGPAPEAGPDTGRQGALPAAPAQAAEDDGRELVFEEWTPPRAKRPAEDETQDLDEPEVKDAGDTQTFDPREWIIEEPPMEVSEDDALFIQAAKSDPGSRRSKSNGEEAIDPENLFAQATMTLEVEDVPELQRLAEIPPEPTDAVSERRLEIPDSDDDDLDVPEPPQDMGEDASEDMSLEKQEGAPEKEARKRGELPAAVARALAKAAEAEFPPTLPYQDTRPLEELLGITPEPLPIAAGDENAPAPGDAEQAKDLEHGALPEQGAEPSVKDAPAQAAAPGVKLPALGGDEILARLLMDQGPVMQDVDETQLDGAVKEYYELFRLSREPFSNSPDPEFYYQAWQHRECLKRIEITVRLRRGMCVILGEVGTGKTTMSRQLHRIFSRDEHVITFLFLEPLFKAGVEFLLQLSETIEAEKPQPGASEHEILESIKNRLFELAVEQDKTVALIFDEGQRIPGHCLELLRLLLNYETNSNKLIQIVIFAQNEFEETIKVQHNFKDRINDLIRLEPLSQRETGEMIRYRLERAYQGYGAPELFTPAALRMVYKLTQGYPRKIVNVCHKTLLALARVEQEVATPQMVRLGAKEATLPKRRRIALWAGLGLAALLALVAALIFLGPWSGDEATRPDQPADAAGAGDAGVAPGPAALPDAIAPPEAAAEPAGAAAAPDAAVAASDDEAVAGSSPAAVAASNGETVAGSGQAAVAASNEEAVAASDGEAEEEQASPPAFDGQAANAASQGEITGIEIAGGGPGNAPASAQGQNADDAAAAAHPEILGSVAVEGEILSQMIYDVYGQFNSDLLMPVIQANPQIRDIDALTRGMQVFFPVLEPQEQPTLPLTRNWLGLGDAGTLQEAYDILRKVRGHGREAYLLSYWSQDQGLQFSVVGRDSYSLDFNTFTVIEGMGELPPPLREHARIISEFPPDTVFFNSKHPMP